MGNATKVVLEHAEQLQGFSLLLLVDCAAGVQKGLVTVSAWKCRTTPGLVSLLLPFERAARAQERTLQL